MRQFDKLNSINSILTIEEYFDEMDLTEEEKEQRKAFAGEIQELMLFIFTLLLVTRQYGKIDKGSIISQLKNGYSDIVLRYMDIDKYLDQYIEEFSEDIIDTTIKHTGDPFYLSEDRSLLICENEANSVFNYKQFSDAKKAGKTKKKWITERDDRVRETHAEINGFAINISDAFLVGGSLMMFPKDTSLNADMEQIAGCRCTVEYF